MLGISGGLFAVLIGAGELLLWLLFATSSHIPGSWLAGTLMPAGVGAILFMLLGVSGLTSALLYSKWKRMPAWPILLSGLLGFPIGYASGSYLVGNWMYWIIPGTLLTASGIIALVTPERITSSLPLVRNDEREVHLLGWALWSGLLIAGLVLVMGGLFLAGLMLSVPNNSPEGNATQDQRDFENAAVAQSMGLLEESLKSYDSILDRNQSNVRAWKEKGQTLDMLGRHEESQVCYERARGNLNTS
jgi:hypothetical protein